MNKKIKYDVGADEALPYQDAAFHAIVWVGVLEQVSYLTKLAAYVPREVGPSGGSSTTRSTETQCLG